jgi:hypothetical protein
LKKAPGWFPSLYFKTKRAENKKKAGKNRKKSSLTAKKEA